MSYKKTLGLMTVCSIALIAFAGHADNVGTGSVGTGSTNTGMIISGSINTGSINTGSINTGSTNTGSTNTGSTTTGGTSLGTGAFQIIIDPITKKISIIYGTGTITTGANNTGATNTGTVPVITSTSGTEFQQALDWMYSNGLTKYYIESEYRPDDFLTREEAAKIIGQAYVVLGYAQTEKSQNCTFLDSAMFEPSLTGFISNACKRGLFKGSNGSFMPRNSITRPEAMAVLIRMFEGKLSLENKNPRRGDYYLKARALGLTTVTNQTLFDHEISRREIAIYIFRLKNIVTNESLRVLSLNKISNIQGTGENITGGIVNSELVSNFSSLANSISVSNDPELQEAISWMNDHGLTKFKTITEYKPFEILNREQAAKILYNFGEVFTFMQSGHNVATAECIFQDINQADESLSPFIINACLKDIMKGSNGYFSPKKTIDKAQFITAIIRMFEGKSLDETIDPRWKNYYETALEMGIVSPADLITFENSITRYEVALFLYRFKVKYQMLQNINTNKTQSEIINTVPGSLITGTGLLPEGNVYVDMNLLQDGNFEIGYIEVFGTRYKIVRSTTANYFSNNFVRYGDVYSLDTEAKIGTISFIISNGYAVDGTIRLTDKTYQISQLEGTNAYYKMKQVR